MFTCPAQGTKLAFDASYTETTGDTDRIYTGKFTTGAFGRLATVGRDPADINASIVCKATVLDGFLNRQVRIVQINVLANQGDLNAVLRGMNPLEQAIPLRPINIAKLQSKTLNQVGIESLTVKRRRNLVNRRHILALDDGVAVDVAHQCNLALNPVRKRTIRTQHKSIGSNTDRTKSSNRVLRRLRLQFAGSRQERNQRNVNKGNVLATKIGAHLTCSFEERLRFNITDGATNFRDDHVRSVAFGIRTSLGTHHAFNFISNMRDNLDGITKVFTTTLLRDHRRVDLTGCRVCVTRKSNIKETLVVTNIEVGLSTIFRHENFTVLEGVHCARIDVNVRIKLLHHNRKTTRTKKTTKT